MCHMQMRARPEDMSCMAPPFTYVPLPKFLDVPRGFREPFPFASYYRAELVRQSCIPEPKSLPKRHLQSHPVSLRPSQSDTRQSFQFSGMKTEAQQLILA